MLDWISNHSSVLQVFTSACTLAIWFFYAQLLYSSYRRNIRPRVLINKGVSIEDLDSPCLICNMSKEPIFIQCLVVELETSEGVYTSAATDSDEGIIKEKGAGSGGKTRQGPLQEGACIDVSTFRELIRRAAEVGGIEVNDGCPTDPQIEFLSVRLTVVSIYGPEDHPFGAARSFSIDLSDNCNVRIQPMSLDTERLTSKKDRKQIREWLWEFI